MICHQCQHPIHVMAGTWLPSMSCSVPDCQITVHVCHSCFDGLKVTPCTLHRHLATQWTSPGQLSIFDQEPPDA